MRMIMVLDWQLDEAGIFFWGAGGGGIYSYAAN
jgi:hypothetical protein